MGFVTGVTVYLFRQRARVSPPLSFAKSMLLRGRALTAGLVGVWPLACARQDEDRGQMHLERKLQQLERQTEKARRHAQERVMHGDAKMLGVDIDPHLVKKAREKLARLKRAAARQIRERREAAARVEVEDEKGKETKKNETDPGPSDSGPDLNPDLKTETETVTETRLAATALQGKPKAQGRAVHGYCDRLISI